MKILFAGGGKTENITNGLRNKYKNTGMDFVSCVDIEEISEQYVKGELFDRIVIMEQAWTSDNEVTNPNVWRQRINDFATDAARRDLDLTYVFVVESQQKAEIAHEEILSIRHNSVVIQKMSDKYSVTYFAKLVKEDIAAFPQDRVYTGEVGETMEEGARIGDDTKNIHDYPTGSHFDPSRDIDFDDDPEHIVIPTVFVEPESESQEPELEPDFDEDPSDWAEPDDAGGDESWDEPPEEEPGVALEVAVKNLKDYELTEGRTEVTEDSKFDDSSLYGGSGGEVDFYGQKKEEDIMTPTDTEENIEDLLYGKPAQKPEEDDENNGDIEYVEQAPGNGTSNNGNTPIERKRGGIRPNINPRVNVNAGVNVATPSVTAPGRGRGKPTKKDRQKKGEEIATNATRQKPERQKSVAEANFKHLTSVLDTFAARTTAIMFIGCGGSGNSTIAYNMANLIASLNYKVLIVDLDTVNRAQGYITKESYDSMEVASAPLRQALASARGMGNVSVVRPALHLLSLGMGGEPMDLTSVLTTSRMLAFSQMAKQQYKFVIYDVPFQVATSTAKDMLAVADNIVLTVAANNWGVNKLLLNVCNIENEETQAIIFERGQLLFNRDDNAPKILGRKAKNTNDITIGMDFKVHELTGQDTDLYFQRMHCCGLIPEDHNHLFESGWCEAKQYTDYPNGRNLFAQILLSTLLKN